MNAPLSADTFRETFCQQYSVLPEDYAYTVLRLTLYPHARWLADAGSRPFLAPDLAFVAAVGQLTRWSAFPSVMNGFINAAENQGFLRQTCRLRVSVMRMRALFSEVMGGDGPVAEPRTRAALDGEQGSLAAD